MSKKKFWKKPVVAAVWFVVVLPVTLTTYCLGELAGLTMRGMFGHSAGNITKSATKWDSKPFVTDTGY